MQTLQFIMIRHIGKSMEQKGNTIFLAIIGYNEPDINQTIKNCLENAEYPDRISFGVWNHFNSEKISVDKFPKCKVVNLEYGSMLGVGLPRLSVLSLYDDEDYILQLDAHMLFDKNWDSTILSRYQNIKKYHENPVLTTYSGWWSRLKDGTITHYSPINNYKSGKMIITSELDGNNPRQTTEPVDWSNKEFEEHYGFSAAFVFSEPKFFKEIIPDPKITFSGEETTTVLRAWTRGFRFFCIPESIVWHRNKGDGVLYEYDRWNTAGDPELASHYYKKTEKSKKRIQDILTGKIIGYWGAPSTLAISSYEKASGVNFKEIYGIV